MQLFCCSLSVVSFESKVQSAWRGRRRRIQQNGYESCERKLGRSEKCWVEKGVQRQRDGKLGWGEGRGERKEGGGRCVSTSTRDRAARLPPCYSLYFEAEILEASMGFRSYREAVWLLCLGLEVLGAWMGRSNEERQTAPVRFTFAPSSLLKSSNR